MISTVNPVQVRSPAQPAAKPKPEPNPIEILQKTISASRLNCWLSCRLKFFFRYVKQISKPPTPSLHIGSVVHLVLKAWSMARWKRQAFELARFKMMFDVCWADQQAKIKWEKEDEPSQKNMA